MGLYPPTKPASEWKIDMVYALRILFHPVDNLDRVLPVTLEPSDDRMKYKYSKQGPLTL